MKKLPIKLNLLTTAVLLTLSYNSYAVTFPLPPENNGLIGNPANRKIVKALKTETLLDIARQYDLGQNQIVWANKGVDRWLPSKEVEFKKLDKEGNNIISKGKGKDIFIPSSYLLPKIKREGIVLNLPEYRLYYYHNGKVTTHPISIGRQNWNTPLGRTRIVKKTKNPTWTPPASIRREHAAQGEILPAVWPAGPNNPLGLYKMSLGRAGYLIHSTNKPLGVGMRVSHGCIRMYPEDIERIFPSIKEGTVVQILNNPIKVGWSNNGLYISVHPDLDDNQRDNQTRLAEAMSLIQEATVGESINIQGSLLKKALTENNGIPVALYKGKRTLIPLLINDELGSQIAPSPAKTLEPTSKKSQIKPKLIQATPSLVGTLPPPPPSVGIKTSLQPKKTTPPPSKKAPKIVAPIAKKEVVKKATTVVNKKAKKEVVKKATTVVNKKAKKEVVKKIAPKTIKKTVKASKKPYVPTPVTPPRLKAIQPKANASRNGYTKSRNSTVKSAKPTRSALPPPPRLTPPQKKVIKKPTPRPKIKAPLPRLHKKPKSEFSILKGVR